MNFKTKYYLGEQRRVPGAAGLPDLHRVHGVHGWRVHGQVRNRGTNREAPSHHMWNQHWIP